MALREYLCGNCGHQFETIKSNSDTTPEQCPQCDSLKTEQLISAFGGYQGNTGSASTRPKSAGAFRKGNK